MKFDSLSQAFLRDASRRYSSRCAELSGYRKRNRTNRCVQTSSPSSNSTTQTESQSLTILNSSAIITLRPFFLLPDIRTTQSVTGGGVAIKPTDKISAGIVHGTSTGSAGYRFLQRLDQISLSQWAAIGILGSLVLGFLTYLTNLCLKIRGDRRKAAGGG